MNTINTRNVIGKYAELKVTDPREDKRGEFAGMSVLCLVGNSTKFFNQIAILGYCSNAIRNYREDAASIMATMIFNKRDNPELVRMIIESVQESTRFKDITSRLVDIKSEDLEVIEKEALPYYDTSLVGLDLLEKTARDKNDVDTLRELGDTFYHVKSRKIEKDIPRALSLYRELPEKNRPLFFRANNFVGFLCLPHDLQKKILVESEVDELWVRRLMMKLRNDASQESMDRHVIRASKFIEAIEKEDFAALECLVKKCHTLFAYSWKQFATIIALAANKSLPKGIAENIHEIDASILRELALPKLDWEIDYKAMFPYLKRIRPPIQIEIPDNRLFSHVLINDLIELKQLCENTDRLQNLESIYFNIPLLLQKKDISLDTLVGIINSLPERLKVGLYRCEFDFFEQLTEGGRFLDRIEYLELQSCPKKSVLPTMPNLRHLKIGYLKKRVMLEYQPRLIDLTIDVFLKGGFIDISHQPKLKAIRINDEHRFRLGEINHYNKFGKSLIGNYYRYNAFEGMLTIHDLPNLRVVDPARELIKHFSTGTWVVSNCPKLDCELGLDEQDD